MATSDSYNVAFVSGSSNVSSPSNVLVVGTVYNITVSGTGKITFN
jgi:hypothetical protein